MRQIRAGVQRDAGILRLHYVIEGRIDAICLPARGVRPIWQHTCCEAFVARPGGPAYHEFNFSPAGDWAAYSFTGYRQGAPVTAPDPCIALEKLHESIEIKASIPAEPGRLLLGLSAVMKEADGRLSYWALRHAPGEPDFHHRHAFALELA